MPAKMWKIIWDTVPLAIEGENKVTALKIQNKKTGEEQQISLEGVFVAVGIVPNTELVQGLVKVDEGGYISAGEDCAASVPGIFCSRRYPHQAAASGSDCSGRRSKCCDLCRTLFIISETNMKDTGKSGMLFFQTD